MANAVIPMFFLGHREAQVVLGVFMVSAASMMVLAKAVGFTRLLGLGHLLWIPLLLYLWSRMGGHPAVELYGAWIRIVMLLNAASLVTDVWDVVRYVRGEREEIVAVGSGR
jgi:roadblock/LC7 domain-containing protein